MNTQGYWRKEIVALVLLGLLFALSACSAIVPTPKDTARENQEKWGIEIISLQMSAAGHMIDFRFRVLDPEKAASLFSRATKPYLIDRESQKVLVVPNMAKVGPLRTTGTPKEGRIYWMFFGNGGGLVTSGSKVTVVIGDFRAENLVVE